MGCHQIREPSPVELHSSAGESDNLSELGPQGHGSRLSSRQTSRNGSKHSHSSLLLGLGYPSNRSHASVRVHPETITSGSMCGDRGKERDLSGSTYSVPSISGHGGYGAAADFNIPFSTVGNAFQPTVPSSASDSMAGCVFASTGGGTSSVSSRMTGTGKRVLQVEKYHSENNTSSSRGAGAGGGGTRFGFASRGRCVSVSSGSDHSSSKGTLGFMVGRSSKATLSRLSLGQYEENDETCSHMSIISDAALSRFSHRDINDEVDLDCISLIPNVSDSASEYNRDLELLSEGEIILPESDITIAKREMADFESASTKSATTTTISMYKTRARLYLCSGIEEDLRSNLSAPRSNKCTGMESPRLAVSSSKTVASSPTCRSLQCGER